MNLLQLAAVKGVFSNIFYIAIAILVLLIMITIHEFGHYIAGKKLGFKINEFAVGFGKKLYSKTTKSGEVFSLRAIPLGGFCAFEGEDENSHNPQAFNRQKPWKRLIVLSAGAIFNFVSAIIFAIVLLTAYGYDVPQVTAISEPGNPNYTIIQTGDVIRGVNGTPINFAKDNTLNAMLAKYEVGEPIILNIEREGQKQEIEVQLYETSTEAGTAKIIGISIKAYPFPFFEAVARSITFVFGMAWKILVLLFALITGKLGLSAVGGPIMTIGTIATYTQASFASFLVLLPVIAVNLAVLNLLPFPALDGSRMVFVGIEWVRKKPVDPRIEGYIHMIGLVLLFAFVLAADFFHLLT